MNVLITGGSCGIGRATADLYAAKGHNVCEISRSGTDRAGVRHIDGDVTDTESVKSAVAAAAAALGTIDILISNAGFGISGPIEEVTDAALTKQFDVNVFGAVRVLREVLPHMRAAGRGRVVLVSSVAGAIPIPFQAYYSMTKAAINSLGLSLRNEMKPFGITATVLMPGDIRTEFTARREKASSEIYTRLESSVARMEQDELHGSDPIKIAKLLYRLGTCRRAPRPLVVPGGKYSLGNSLYNILPKRLANFLIGKMYS